MARKKKEPSENIPVSHTMPQTTEAQKASRQLSELPDLKQHPDAPKISGYILVKPLGQGAYAQVWEAIQVRTRKFVAIKVFTKKSGIHWFFLQREADRLIRLDKHPHIVSLLDADLGGQIPYYVMDLVQEGSLERFVEEDGGITEELDLEKVEGWIEEVAQALHYVHSKQMVHCDLKPANVLLDEEGHVRVADFGHSRVLSESGSSLGTLFFMAPEQAVLPEGGEPPHPDVRWDIYALGCTTYALLSHHVPHGEIGGKLETTPGLKERLQLYRQAIASQPVPPLWEATQHRVDKDLSAIVAKCMATDPKDRYASVAEVLKDLKARREGRPVSPLAHDKGYWLGKFILRYRTSVLIAAVSLVIVLTALFFQSKHQAAQIQDTAFNYVLRGREYLEKGDEASAVAYFAASNKIYPSLLARGNAFLHMPPIPKAFFAHDGALVAVTFSPDGKVLMTAGGTTGARLWNPETGQPLGRPLKLEGTLTAAAFSPDGSELALGGSTGEARVYEVAHQKPLGHLLNQGKQINSVAISGDDRRLLTGGADGRAKEWDIATGTALPAVMEHDRPILEAAFNPTGDRVLTVDKEGAVQLWNAQSGEALGSSVSSNLKGAPSWYRPSMAFNPNGRGFLVTGWDGSVKFYDNRGKKSGRTLFLEGIGARAVYNQDGSRILASVIYGGSVGLARVFNARTHMPLRFSLKTDGKIGVLAFSPDGRQVLTGGTDHVVRVWDAATGKPSGRDFWQEEMVTAAAFSTDAKSLAAGGKDGLACLWPLSGRGDDDEIFLDWKNSPCGRLKKIHQHGLLSPDLKKSLTYGGKSACLWDAQTGKPEGGELFAGGEILRAVFSPDGSKLLTCDADSEARLWDLKTRNFKSLAAQKAVRGGAFSADGSRLVTGGEDKKLRLWDLESGKEWGSPLDTGFAVSKALLSSDGERMAALGAHGALRLYPVQKTGSEPLLKVQKGVQSPVFSPDGRYLVYALGRSVKIHDAKTGNLLRTLDHGPTLSSVLVGPESLRVASMGTDGTLQLWDITTGLPVGNPMKHEGSARDWVFSPRGGVLLAAYQDGGWKLWDTRTSEAIGEEMFQGSLVRSVGFEPDGKALKVLGKDGDLELVNTDWMDAGTDPDRLLLISQVAGRTRVDAQGTLEPISADQWVRLWAQYRKEK